jgi:hypothetical protein
MTSEAEMTWFDLIIAAAYGFFHLASLRIAVGPSTAVNV